MVELQQILNQVTKAPKSPVNSAPDLTPSDRERCMNILLRGFRMLSELTTSIRFQSAWKAGHAADIRTTIDHDTNELMDPTTPGIEYALASVGNHTRSEMKVLVDVVSMIKSLASLLRRAEGMLAPVIRSHIHRTTQLFVQHTVLCLLYKAHKHKRKEETEHLLQMRCLCADWSSEIEPFEDYKSRAKVTEVRDSYESLERRSAETKAESVAPIPSRSVAPSASQLHLLRSMVFALYDDRAPWLKKGGMFTSGTFTKKDMSIMTDYHDRSEYFAYALDASTTVERCSDTSSLWYREFYLEMTKQVQFPISMSMPWRLAEHVIRSPQNNMLENMLYAMDIYNDAARVALDVLRQR
jgi:cytoplasmic FMR1 interacting protein